MGQVGIAGLKARSEFYWHHWHARRVGAAAMLTGCLHIVSLWHYSCQAVFIGVLTRRRGRDA